MRRSGGARCSARTDPARRLGRLASWDAPSVVGLVRNDADPSGDGTTGLDAEVLGPLGSVGRGSGAHFASLWGGSDEERAHALEYLENDLRLTKAVAERIIPAGFRVIERRAA